MKTVAPIPVAPGTNHALLPHDAEAVGVVATSTHLVLLTEVNPITAPAARKVTWVVHGIRADQGGTAPDKAEFVGAAAMQLPDGSEALIAVYVEAQPILTPGAGIGQQLAEVG
jgi:hypothetical protein